MSAGGFSKAKYEADDGTIYAIRSQPETAAMTVDGTANSYPAGAVTATVRARTSGSRRSYGVFARMFYVQFSSTLPTGYQASTTIALPIFKPTLFNAFTPDVEGTYLGNDIIVVGRRSEKIK